MQPADAAAGAAHPAPTEPTAAASRAAVARAAARPDTAWAELGFFLLFPGFFAYQTLLGLGLIRAYLGGYFAAVSLLLLPAMLLTYWRRLHRARHQLPRVDAALLAFLAYFGAMVACHAPSANPAITAHHALALLYLFNLFVIFSTLDCTSRRFRLTQYASLAAMSCVVFAYAVDGAFYLAALGEARDPDSVATYQGFSRSYLLPLAAVLATTRQAPLRWGWYALGAATLYVNTARSEFGALLFLVPLIELHAARHRAATAAAFAALALLMPRLLALLLAAVPGNRTLELLDLSHSSSANMRHQLTLNALRTLGEHPILGDYGSYPVGLYSHNILSAWVDLGLFGFAALLALLLYPLLQMGLHTWAVGGRDGRGPAFLLAWSLLGMTVLLLCLSHFFSDMLIGAALGAYARYRAGADHA